MPSETIRVDNDSHTNEQRPNDESGDSSRLVLRGGSPNRKFVFLWFNLPSALVRIPTIREAILRITPKHQWLGTRTITAQAVATSWREGRVNWDNQPGVSGASAAVIVIDQPADEEFQIDVTSQVQTIANTQGLGNYGFRVVIDSAATGKFYLHSSESGVHKPKLDLSWAQVPYPPVDLYPSGSRSVVVSQPVLTWNFKPVGGFSGSEATQAEVQLEVRNPTTDALIYDSGRRVHSDTEFNLASPPAGAPAFGALTDGTEVKWRVKVWDDDGLASDYSDYVRFRYDSPGVLTITSPTGATTEDKTPPITWTFTGRTQERIELTLWERNITNSRWDRIYQFDPQAYTLGSKTIPEGKITRQERDYKARVRVWDTLDREEQHGYIQAIKVFRYVRSGVPGAPLTFTLATSDPTPKLLADWTNPTAGRPDHFALWRDGEVLIPRLDPDVYETSAGASSYQAALYYSEPYVSHTYDLVAVVNSAGVLKESPPISQTKTIRPIGIWLVAPEDGVEVPILAREQPDMSITEVGETFQPLGRRGAVRVVESIGGWAGTVSGTLSDFNGISVETYRDRLETLKGYVNQEEIRLLIGRYNFPVVLEEGTSFPPSPDGSYEVSLPFYQSGEYFTTRV